jgi:DNA-directed RNA polymerase sigma subunit (sigma70/sigma32)
MWAFVANHPDGATENAVAEALGISRERVRQWEARAMRRARNGRALPEIDDDDEDEEHER